MGNDLVTVPGVDGLIPAQVAAAGGHAARRFIEFFTANIRNPNTRAGYARAVSDFFHWCEWLGLGELAAIQPVHVAGYIEELGKSRSAPTVKQHLAAVRMLFDWLVVGQVVPANPASVVRGPRHVVKRGKTPILTPERSQRGRSVMGVGRRCGAGRAAKRVPSACVAVRESACWLNGLHRSADRVCLCTANPDPTAIT
jgi:hypothetical protein